MASACSDDDDGDEVATSESTASEDPVAAAEARVEAAESGVTDSEEALVAAHEQFCVDAESYIEVLDRYGKLFTDDVATVGDVETAGADLVEPRETVATSVDEVEAAKTAVAEAGQELVDAQVALAEAIATASSVPTSVTTPDTTTTTTLVPAGHDRARPAGRRRARRSRRGDHGGDPAGGGDGGVQLGGVRAADRMAAVVLRCRTVSATSSKPKRSSR